MQFKQLSDLTTPQPVRWDEGGHFAKLHDVTKVELHGAPTLLWNMLALSRQSASSQAVWIEGRSECNDAMLQWRFCSGIGQFRWHLWKLSNLNKSMQVPYVNTLTQNDKLNVFMKKLQLWTRTIGRNILPSFLLLTEAEANKNFS
jgi:hypothetical protein